MDLRFTWEALIILFVGFCLLRILGKKAVSQMTGLEIITLLAMASMIGHAVAGKGLWETVITLSIFVGLLLTIQFLALKFDLVERMFLGKAILVIQNGVILKENLKKLRMTVDQLETRLREKGISSLSDVKTATIEISGEIGYELTKNAKPVTVGEMQAMLANLLQNMPAQQQQKQNDNLFNEVRLHEHQHPISPEMD